MYCFLDIKPVIATNWSKILRTKMFKALLHFRPSIPCIPVSFHHIMCIGKYLMCNGKDLMCNGKDLYFILTQILRQNEPWCCL